MPGTMDQELPLEMWAHVFQSMGHGTASPSSIISLWTEVRPICRQFRDYVEDIFTTKWIPEHMEIMLYGGRVYDKEDHAWIIQGGFTFKSFSEDGKLVTFYDKNLDKSMKEPDSMPAEVLKRWMEIAAEKIKYCNSTIHPTCIVRVRDLVNDTGVVGRKYDKEQCLVTFDWRSTLSSLLFEEREVERINTTEVLAKQIGGIKPLAPGDMEGFMAMLSMWGNVEKDKRKQVRRQRMRRRAKLEVGHEISEDLLPKYDTDEESDDETCEHNNFMRDVRVSVSNTYYLSGSHEDDDDEDDGEWDSEEEDEEDEGEEYE
eukprot:Phypoly_transcript_02148.p2 GENE.Phypoly_transcript_02148~~Phypoly_transcript_02148.p2  ORF type:complete len:315 (+),score=59.83 Phypoly_transcript_02148:1834-2778(+)